MDRKIIYGAAGLLCLLAVFPFPYAYYSFLRLALTAAALVAVFDLKNNENYLWLLFGGIALLFNPLFPIYLTKGIWFPIDLIAALAFGWLTWRA